MLWLTMPESLAAVKRTQSSSGNHEDLDLSLECHFLETPEPYIGAIWSF